MDRIRLTQRMASKSVKADAAQPETSIDLGKNRTYHKIDKYHTFKPSLNHWEPDMRHEWKEDKRDEVGFGIPKPAAVYLAAQKATKLAMIFLGKDADENNIEKQAKAFMRMGDRALTATINRWAACNGCEDGECEKEEPAVKADDEKMEDVPAVEAPAEEAPAEPAPTEEIPVEEAPAEEAPAEEEKEAAAEDDEIIAVDDELVATDVDFDDECTAGDAEVDADKELEACFANEEEEATPVVEEPAPAAKKAGVKRLNGQPTLQRVASKKVDDLAGLWDKWSNPDIR